MFEFSKFQINLNSTIDKSDSHGSQIRLSESNIHLQMFSSTWLVSNPALAEPQTMQFTDISMG